MFGLGRGSKVPGLLTRRLLFADEGPSFLAEYPRPKKVKLFNYGRII